MLPEIVYYINPEQDEYIRHAHRMTVNAYRRARITGVSFDDLKLMRVQIWALQKQVSRSVPMQGSEGDGPCPYCGIRLNNDAIENCCHYCGQRVNFI